MSLRIFPEMVRRMQASRTMRTRHELWHYVRAVWNNPRFPKEGKDILKSLGWELPDDRGPFDASRHLLLDNNSGEDFLYMHRQMIDMTDRNLQSVNEPPITRWQSVPEPGDSDFPVPSYWEYNDPEQSNEDNKATTRFLQNVKSDEYYEQTMKVRESFLTNPRNLRMLSLGALGNLAEMTIHNMMHMRWSSDPGRYRPNINLQDPTDGDVSWDDISYDYLGDTYSSHVNPHFWYLHGWIDNLIDLWADANRVEKINWKGTWLGGPDLEAPSVGDTEPMTLAHAESTSVKIDMAQRAASLIKLQQISRDFSFPSTLIEIAREQAE